LANNPTLDHSIKVEETLLDHGADINAQNKRNETPMMLLFKMVNEKNELKCGAKFDPIASLMVLLKSGANITLKSKSELTALHFACIRGSTISALTLLNNGAD
jgi:ankyrin repeat protein